MQLFFAYIDRRLESIYSKNERKTISHLLLNKVAGMSRTQIYCDKDTKFKEDLAKLLASCVDRLFEGEPIQYVVGETEFFDLSFAVRPGVLIPRPETEELVELILIDSKNASKLRLLDIGTGSGCIAISLAKNLPDADVTAWDISPDALNIADENAKRNNVRIHFHLEDARKPTLHSTDVWDIVVSNPPYVRESEKTSMERHVLDREPHLALFVKDEDPLLFYRTISQLAFAQLSENGKLYFEINSYLGQETLDVVKQAGFAQVDLFKDLSGRDRMIRANR